MMGYLCHDALVDAQERLLGRERPAEVRMVIGAHLW